MDTIPTEIFFEIFHYLSQLDLLIFKLTSVDVYNIVSAYIKSNIKRYSQQNITSLIKNDCAIYIRKYMTNIDKTLYSILSHKKYRLFDYLVFRYNVADFSNVVKIACENANYNVFHFCWNKPHNKNNTTIYLVQACKGGNINIVATLLTFGANNGLERALTIACLYKHSDVCELLIKFGAKECFNSVLVHYHNLNI